MTDVASLRPRTALVLSGGGARGAYEAGVLSYLFDAVLADLGPAAEFDVASGTSVGAIHAAYTIATRGRPGAARSRVLLDAWKGMRVSQMLRLGASDLLRIPLRTLGLWRAGSRESGRVLGGLVDVSRLEQLVEDSIPWEHLSEVLATEPVALCTSCTEVRSGRVTVFMAGTLADSRPWSFDPNAQAVLGPIDARHVRASAAIPFLFPAVRIDDRYYVDGGLRMNTPLSPALRLGASRIFVVCLKHPPKRGEHLPAYPESVITDPAFLIGKVLDALTLDQLEYELERLALVNDWIAEGEQAYGADFLNRINVAVRARRGADYRRVDATALHPSEDLGKIAAECLRREGTRLPPVARWLARQTMQEENTEADLLSYLLFDGSYTGRLVELGRADAEQRADEIRALLAPPPPSS